MNDGTRQELLGHLAEAIGSVTIDHPTRVAIDGPPAAGKTRLGNELAVILRERGREVIRVSIESYLRPQSERYRRGEYSAEGCYDDSFDFEALHQVLLDPLGPGGDRQFRQAVYDRSTESELSLPVLTAPTDAVLLFDGVFLLRPELNERWDFRIFVSTSFEVALVRARDRDLALFGSATAVDRRHRERYGPSQQFYFETVCPTEHADVVVHNDDPDQPVWESRNH